MGKIFAKKWGIGLGICSGVSVILCIFNLILCLIGAHPNATAAYIYGGIIGAIGGSITEGIYCKFIEPYNTHVASSNYWANMLAQNRQIKFCKVLCHA